MCWPRWFACRMPFSSAVGLLVEPRVCCFALIWLFMPAPPDRSSARLWLQPTCCSRLHPPRPRGPSAIFEATRAGYDWFRFSSYMLFFFPRQHPCSGSLLSPQGVCPLTQRDAFRFQGAAESHKMGGLSHCSDEAIFRLTNQPPWNSVQANKNETKEFNTKRKS